MRPPLTKRFQGATVGTVTVRPGTQADAARTFEHRPGADMTEKIG